MIRIFFLFSFFSGASAFGASWDYPYIPLRPGTLCLEQESAAEDIKGGRILRVARNCLTALDWISPSADPWEYNPREKYEQNFGGKKGKEESFSIDNLELVGTAKERQTFLRLVGIEKREGHFVPEEIGERIQEGNCPKPVKVLCALESLYGQNDDPKDSPEARREAGMRAMNMAFEFGYMATPRTYMRIGGSERRRAYATPEWGLRAIKDMDTVFRKFPTNFHRMDTIKYIYRTMSRDQGLLSMRTNAWTYNGETPEIVFKQSTFNKLRWNGGSAVGVEKGDQQDGSCTMAHEIAHAFEFQNPELVNKLNLFRGDTNRWGFSISSTRGTTHRGLEKLSTYAFTNRHEYFAVAVGEYFCNPEGLQKNAPGLFAALREGLFESRDFLPRGEREKDFLKNKIRERKLKEGNFDLVKLSKDAANSCLGGPNIHAKFRVDPATKRGHVYYYKKGYIREGGKLRQVLVGRSGQSEHFKTCLHKKAEKFAETIVAKFPDCHPPDKNGLVENIISGAGGIIDDYDDLIRKKAGPRVEK